MTQPTDHSAFAAFVPGFEFLKKLAQGQQAPLSQWIAPTLDPKALEQRIAELKAVQFWLEQNAAALKATLQALEVQKMTMATLQTMGAAGLGAMTGGGAAAKAAAGGAKAAGGAAAFDPKEAWAAAASMPQAVEYWGALTKQFQKIAGDAMKDMGQHAATLQAQVADVAATVSQAAKAGGKSGASAKTAAKPASKAAPRKRSSRG